jgi:putative tributyrin esterase
MIAALLLAVTVAADSLHGSVVTDTLWSQALGAKKAVIVYLPPSYRSSPERRYPVAYYLHGVSGSETGWTKNGHIDAVMDSLVAAGEPEMIVVMPDGDDGWYTTWNTLITYDACAKNPTSTGEPVTTYCVPWQHYDDYIARDLVQFTDKKYRTRPDRAHRAIAGLSMGGYGAITLALSYPDVFAAAASHSGTLAPLYAGPAPFDGHPVWAADLPTLEKAWGRLYKYIVPAFGRDTAAWWSRDPARRLQRLIALRGKSAVPEMFADVGKDDPFVEQTRAFKWEAWQQGIPIEYHEWTGTHDWAYWKAHVPESLHWIGAQIGR